MSRETCLILSAAVVACAGATVLASPLGTAFTYQGLLNDAGSPVDATADFEFRLFDAASTGALIAGPVSVSNVDVIEGLFTATVDFGAPAFNGEARWLAIATRSPAGGGTFTTLSPRQPLTAAPYARFAAAAPWAGLTGIPAGFADGIDNGSGDGHSLDAADGSPADALFVNNAGNVGIGTVTPAKRLHVNAIDGIHIGGDPAGGGFTGLAFSLSSVSGGYAQIQTIQSSGSAWGNLALNPLGGTIGVGTTAPNAGLHVKKEPTPPGGTFALEGTTHTYMSFFPDGVAAGRKAYVGFPGAAVTDIHITNEYAAGNIVLAPGAGGAVSVPVLEITGADPAEKFPTSDNVEPGMVVAIDPSNPGKLCLARGAYNRAVAGVVSGANDFAAGAILGNLPGHEDAPPIALSGRVYVWCDASYAAIQPGDLLTTSDTPGHAMKVSDHACAQGAVLGKAMTVLDSGRGLVLVLVSLQ